jgi:hypothetical protein
MKGREILSRLHNNLNTAVDNIVFIVFIVEIIHVG